MFASGWKIPGSELKVRLL